MVYKMPAPRWWPSYCALCGLRAAGPLDLCDGCADELPWLGNHCACCALPLPRPGLCGGCLQRPPPFVRCVAPLRYEPPVDHLITRFKYGGEASAGQLLSRLLLYALDSAGSEAELLVPMPLHWRRRWQRGFNQAAQLADLAGRGLQLPVATTALQRLRPTAPQQGLAAADRRRNLCGAFRATAQVAGRRIALVDDVVTTASSASEATRALLAAGAVSVEVWCAARTP